MNAFGCGVFLFLLAVFHLTIKANLSEKVILSDKVWYCLIGFVAFSLLWLINIFRTFLSRN
jgi:uncharacterized membrane protein YvlD (DUF360 family)